LLYFVTRKLSVSLCVFHYAASRRKRPLRSATLGLPQQFAKNLEESMVALSGRTARRSLRTASTLLHHQGPGGKFINNYRRRPM
jgi:hypothetical protein